MKKPSEHIKSLHAEVTVGLFNKARGQAAAQGHVVIPSDMERRQIMTSIGADPMTWVMAIITYLDSQAQALQPEADNAAPPSEG